jgi:hypothetical protein
VLFASLLGSIFISTSGAADLGWDLSYRTVLKDHPMVANEFMRVWPERYPKRLIHERLRTYQGEMIEDSVLVEEPDSHTGDPLATWFIKTRSGAQLCVFHPKFSDRPCTPLARERVTALIEEIMGFAPLPLPAAKPSPEGKVPGGDEMQSNYFGFLSVYHAGKTLQRPIAMGERIESLLAADAGITPGNGRLGRALQKASMSPEEFAKQKSKLDQRSQMQRLHEAIRQGDLKTMGKLLDEGVPLVSRAPFTEPAVAAGAGQKAAVDLLLLRGARIDAKESAALKAAVNANDASMIEHLLARGAKIDPPEDSLEANKEIFETALGRAVRDGKMELVELLLQRGANIDPPQSTPIIVSAAMRRDIPLLKLLLERGGNPNRIGEIHHMSALTLLADLGSKLRGMTEGKPASSSMEETETKIGEAMRLLVAHGARVNTLRFPCETAYSAARNSETIKAELVRLGADPELHLRCNEHFKKAEREEKEEEEQTARYAVALEVWESMRYADFQRLETLYQNLLKKNEKTPAGTAKLAIYYNELNARLPRHASVAQKKTMLEKAKAWAQETPSSVAAQIFLANAVAANVPGENAILSTPEANRQKAAADRERAMNVLELVRQDAKNDPEWQRAMLMLLWDSQAPAGDIERLIQQAMSEQIDYPELYFAAATYLNSQPDNAASRIDTLARDAVKATRKRQGQSMYARIYWYLDQAAYNGKLFEKSQVRWADMKRGFDDMVERFPAAWNLNAYAYYACRAGDYKTMEQVVGRIGERLVFRAWGLRKNEGPINYNNCLSSRPNLAPGRRL